MKKPVKLIVMLLVVTLLLQPGCGISRPDFKEVITKAIEVTGEVKKYRMEMESDRIGNGEMEKWITSAEFVAPDRMRQISRDLKDDKSGEESIQIGTIRYTRRGDSTEWNVHDWGNERLAVYNLYAGMLQSFESLADIKELGDERIDGINCFHYTGRMGMQARQQERLNSLNQSDPNYEQIKLSIELLEYTKDYVEFWIGKDDFLLWQYRVNMETVYVHDRGEDTEERKNYSNIMTVKFSDFNELIEIEPPVTESDEGVDLKASMSSTGGGGDDLEHYQVDYKITIRNRGIETARDIRIFLDTPATN